MLIELDYRIFNLQDITKVGKKLQAFGSSQSTIEFYKGITVVDSVVFADDTVLEGVWSQILTAGAVAVITI
jgi:hypothetical protein